MARRFESREGSSHKFWEIEQQGIRQIVRFGRIGTEGQTKEKEFDSKEDAVESCEKLIREKTGKGYKEVTDGTPRAKKPAKKAAAIKPSSSKAGKSIAEDAPRPTVKWTEDDRQEIAIWLGEFETKKDLSAYVHGKTNGFCTELGLPQDIWCFSSFSNQSGDLIQLLKKAHSPYRSYAAAATKKVEKLGLKSFNAILYLSSAFADRDVSKLASRATFVGYFPFRSAEKKGLINNAHIWFARFPSNKRLDKYMKETYGADDDETPISEFARDQKEAFYDHDLVYAEFENNADLNKLIGGWGFPEKSVKQVLKTAAKMPIKDANVCFVADEDEFDSPRSVKGKDYEVWYVGQFDGCTK